MRTMQNAQCAQNHQRQLARWGANVRQARLGKFSQSQLATFCGVRQGTVSKIERGLLEPSFALQWAIAGALGRSLEELFSAAEIVPPFPSTEVAA